MERDAGRALFIITEKKNRVFIYTDFMWIINIHKFFLSTKYTIK